MKGVYVRFSDDGSQDLAQLGQIQTRNLDNSKLQAVFLFVKQNKMMSMNMYSDSLNGPAKEP